MPLIAAYPNVIGNVENDTLFRPTHMLALPETPCPTPNQQGNFLRVCECSTTINRVHLSLSTLSSTTHCYRIFRLSRRNNPYLLVAQCFHMHWSTYCITKMPRGRPTSNGILRRLFYYRCSGDVVTLKQSVHMSTKGYHSPNARHNTSTALPSYYYHQQDNNDYKPKQSNGG